MYCLPNIRICMYGCEINLLNKMIADKICADLVTRVYCLLFWHWISIESFHAYCQQVVVVNGFYIASHFLNPSLPYWRIVISLRKHSSIIINMCTKGYQIMLWVRVKAHIYGFSRVINLATWLVYQFPCHDCGVIFVSNSGDCIDPC